MKKIMICAVTLSCIFISTNCFAADITKEQVVSLVEKTCEDIKADAKGTFEKITNAESPYTNAQNPAFYVFVYDTEVVIVAHPKKNLIGRSYKGKPDVKGKKFRDDIVKGALEKGTGWVDYFYKKPEEKGIHQKTTYYKLVTGSDGNKYVVASGKYL
nr:cache domain-containing protein [uncultured Desulfobacter sp.]